MTNFVASIFGVDDFVAGDVPRGTLFGFADN